MRRLKSFITKQLSRFGLTLMYSEKYSNLLKDSDYFSKYKILETIKTAGGTNSEISVQYASEIFKKSKSQLGQDIYALAFCNFKRAGYFVEFGATNGVSLSNTWLLEKEFGWTGLLAEPAKIWHEDLVKTRDAEIGLDCIWSSTGETLAFSEVEELSTI